MDTWSAKPFISHDGFDDDGVRAEVKVIVGVGRIKKIEESDNGRASQVIFSVSNTGFPVKCWVPQDDPTSDAIAKAQKNNDPLGFRVEIRRKNTIDRGVPISELTKDMETARDSVFRSLAAVRPCDSDEWVCSDKMVTNFAEDPQEESGLHSAKDYTPEQLKSANANKTTPVEAEKYSESVNIRNLAALDVYTFVVNSVEASNSSLNIARVIVACAIDISKKFEIDTGVAYELLMDASRIYSGSFSTRDDFVKFKKHLLTESTKVWTWIAEQK